MCKYNTAVCVCKSLSADESLCAIRHKRSNTFLCAQVYNNSLGCVAHYSEPSFFTTCSIFMLSQTKQL